ncbi:hypothetical protein IGI04_006543 [Brassica rapa subsp. trilocularis]|uniref:Dof-type domain-containing protein n=1 Tax=Brassica rapa subsp. trilocularis TaxID=1813537 RepID=A0ABQ7NH93_BRACM|nr:hypothetical protein IGI04_006543 [Brassica rapa subsp. trilocularis]
MKNIFFFVSTCVVWPSILLNRNRFRYRFSTIITFLTPYQREARSDIDCELSFCKTNGTCSQETKLKKPEKFCLACDATAWRPSSVLQLVCKKCQRYWTAGGMMRNILVSAGRRKNKNMTSHNNCNVSRISTKAMLCIRRLQKIKKSLIFNILMAPISTLWL